MTIRGKIHGFLVAGLLGAAFAASGLGQDSTELDLSTAYDRAVKAIEDGTYDAGLAVVNTAINDHSSGALEAYGPVFGHFYFIT